MKKETFIRIRKEKDLLLLESTDQELKHRKDSSNDLVPWNVVYVQNFEGLTSDEMRHAHQRIERKRQELLSTGNYVDYDENSNQYAPRDEVEALKEHWENDPLEDIKGRRNEADRFYPYEVELTQFQEEKEAFWTDRLKEQENADRKKAEELGLLGLYRQIQSQQEVIELHELAIQKLAAGLSGDALHALRGRS